MPYFDWSPEFEVGVEVIDYQHRRLVQLINDLHDTSSKNTFQEGLMDAIFEELTNYTRFHFRVEEKLMERVNYINISDHRLQHGNFIKRLEEFKSRYKEDLTITKSLLDFLKNWLKQHILREDQEISEFINHREGLV